MKRPERLEDYLEHICEANSRAIGYVEQTPDVYAFQQDQRTQDAVVRNIEIIGEAVSKLQKSAPDFIDSHPDIPWAKIRAMRNLVIHEYFFLDLKVVWSTVKNELPKLRDQVEALLAQRRRVGLD